MAFFQYLVFDGENLPLPDSYEGKDEKLRLVPKLSGRRTVVF